MLPKQLTLEAIEDILSRKAIEEFVDASENEIIEFKGEPYRLEDDQQKTELAKDLTTFANTTGGFIVLGVKTGRIPDHPADVAQELRPIPRRLVRDEQYLDVARDWIYPSINSLRVRFIETHTDPERGIVVLEISPSLALDKPFLIVKTTDSIARRERRILFGYAERFDSRSLPVVVQRLQQLLHLGLTFENYQSFQQGVETRLEKLETAVLRQAQISEVTSREERTKKLKENLQRASVEGAISDRPRLWLIAAPEQPASFPSLFSSREDPLVKALENPPELRDSGFDFALHKPSEIIRASIRRIMIQGYKLIQLSVDGELIVIVLGDEDFIGWNVAPRPGQPIRINSFVLAEVTYTFALYVKEIYSFAEPKPKELRLCIGLADMERDGKFPILSSLEARPNIMHSASTDKEAPASSAALYVSVPFDETPERMAFVLRAELYRWFGFDDSQVPYVEEIEGKNLVTMKSLFKPIIDL